MVIFKKIVVDGSCGALELKETLSRMAEPLRYAPNS
jgi:hypothetical protein